MRSIQLGWKEVVWLANSFGELMAVEDSRVFRDESIRSFPCVLAQKCFNRHGSFLALEEYEGRERRGRVLVPEGRSRKGWIRLQSELSIAFDYVQPFVGNAGKVATGKQRRSFTEVLLSTTKQVEEPFGSFAELIARVPKWLSGGNVGISKPSGSTFFIDGQLRKINLFIKPRRLFQRWVR